MNIGGDSGRDDYGLPPVDIEIPDDARELDRDVHAYHRELRAQRRRMLTQRLHAPLTRDGMVLPLLAGCLALTLLAATLLTVFTAGQASFGPTPASRVSPSARSSRQSATHPSQAPAVPTAGQVGGPLPGGIAEIGGQQTPLSTLHSSALALVPPGCKCVDAIRQLARQADQAGVQTYLVGTQSRQVTELTRQAGLGAAHGVVDIAGAFTVFHHQGRLTAVLVAANGLVTTIQPYRGRPFQLRGALRSLVPAAG